MHVLRQHVLADSLDEVRMRRIANFFVIKQVKENRAIRVRADILHFATRSLSLLLQVATHARQSSTRAHAADENVDLTLHLLPNFRTRRSIMNLRICRIVVLIGQHSSGRLFHDSRRHRVVRIRIVGLKTGWSHHHSRAIGAKHGPLLL